MSADEGGEAMSKPTTNGELNSTTVSESSAPATIGKRKRVHSHDERLAQEDGSPSVQPQEKNNVTETLRDLVEVLSKYATLLKFMPLLF